MSELPPTKLVEQLERLGLASAEQVAGAARYVHRLAKDLPTFDSVWIDALAQARVITPFQAARLNVGEGESLRVGSFLLCERLAHPLYVACYRAKNVESGEFVRLVVSGQWPVVSGQCETASGCFLIPNPQSPIPSLQSPSLLVSQSFQNGRTAAEWIMHHGRFPGEVVLEIARAMAAELAELETNGKCHGDVSLSSLLLTDSGEISLLFPGLRGVLRPEEGYAHADLPPEAFESLAPERISAGTSPNMAGDIYACGCVWWHLLCGRSPLAGGDSLTKLRAVQAGGIGDVRRHASDVPTPLATAIAACVEVDPSRRPESAARLAAMLGPTTSNGRAAVADCLAKTGRPTVQWTTTARAIRRSNRTPLYLAAAACCLATLVAVGGHFWHGPGSGKVASGQWSVVSAKPLADFSPQSPVSNPQSLIPNPSSRVVPAAYQETSAKPQDIVLADAPVAATSLRLHAGQCVRAAGRRATLLVPPTGWIVDKENVRFENIDFIFDATANGNFSEDAAIVRLQASRAEFRGCAFRCRMPQNRDRPNFRVSENGTVPFNTSSASAVCWQYPNQADAAGVALPNGRIRLADCFFDRVGVGVDCRTAGALGIELTNTLHLGPGPLVRLDHCPRADEPLSLGLSQVTLRDGSLLEILDSRAEKQPGEIAISATACVFAPAANEPLMCCHGGAVSERLVRVLRWTGQGSLVTPRSPVLAWRDRSERLEVVDESSLSIAGLVRNEVEFVGEPSRGASASRVLRWQAPLQSANPPGVEFGREGLGIGD